MMSASLRRFPPRAATALLVLLLLLAAPRVAAPEDPAPPATLQELLDRAEKCVVALKVERSKDLTVPRGNPAAPTKEMQAYYRRPEGWVSGILVDAAGHIVTSYYNVGGDVKSLQVMVPSGQTYAARVLSKSVADDLALVKIERAPSDPEIPFSEPLWGDASPVRAGQVIFALGRSPDPRKLTVTRGILSAVGRNGGRAVQTDAELNYGNVGGPIVGLDGRVVAIANFVGHTRPMWGINSGVGFGTTTTAFLGMLPVLKQGKDFTPFRFPFLGIQGDRNYVGPNGARIDRVVPDGPASKAGIKAGDLIVEFNGTPVENFDHLRHLIFKSAVGSKVKVKVRRGDENLDFEPVLEEMKEP